MRSKRRHYGRIETIEDIQERCTMGKGDCWVWTAGTSTRDYIPSMRWRGKTASVRRVVYQLKRGRLLAGQCIVAACGTPKCINPDHLEQITHNEKTRRAQANVDQTQRRRRQTETRRARSKLDQTVVREIRASQAPGVVIAERYGITQQAVSAIRNYRVWKPDAGMWSGLMR